MNLLSFAQGEIYPQSQVEHDQTTYALARVNAAKVLLVQGDQRDFQGTPHADLLVCVCSAHNAMVLRSRLPWLRPMPLGRATSFGFGDRLGLATPGHVASVRSILSDKVIAPIFAQQSVRENDRTGRTPQAVLDDAMWGVFQTGWRAPWGADADHVKEVKVLAPFLQAGYTFYTIDPSDHVDSAAQRDTLARLQDKAANFPWEQWGTTYQELQATYQRPNMIGDLDMTFDERTLLRALVKYGRAILHTATIANAINTQMSGAPYDLEMSVDETDTPTSIHEHYFIANELLRRGIPVVSLAPRFVGKFQKGVDYMGDLAEFEAELVKHMTILHHFGQYKISVHTGSDKFSIYAIVNKHAHGYVHVKTAGTSYLEALRVVAQINPPLFRACLDLAHKRFQTDRKSYFLDCQPERVPTGAALSDAALPILLADESFDARQLLHATFGSILDAYGQALTELLRNEEELYRQGLQSHFARHLQPFAVTT